MDDLKEKWMKEQLEKELQLELVETIDWNTQRLEELQKQLVGFSIDKKNPSLSVPKNSPSA